METTHHYPRTTTNSGKITVPFYEPPSYIKKTSAEIINEARASIGGGSNTNLSISSLRMAASIRTVETERPFTPRDPRRVLFGSSRKTRCRPPSSFSLDYLQFQDQESGNVSPNIKRLNPIRSTSLPSSPMDKNDFQSWKQINESKSYNDIYNTRTESHSARLSGKDAVALHRLKLPSIYNASTISYKRHSFRITASLDNLPEEMESDFDDNSQSDHSIINEKRKAYSSPVERTKNVVETDFHSDNLNEKSVQAKHISTKSEIAWGNDIESGLNTLSSSQLNLHKDTVMSDHINEENLKGKEEGIELFSSTRGDKQLQINYNDSSLRSESLNFSDVNESKSNSQVESSLLNEMENNSYNETESKLKKIKLQSKCAATIQEPSSKMLQHNTKGMKNIDDLTTLSSQNIIKPLHPLGCNENNDNSHIKESNLKDSTKTIEIYPNLSISHITDKSSCFTETSQVLIKLLSDFPDKGYNSQDVVALLTNLYMALHAEGHIGPSTRYSKLKSQVLKVMYKFVESSDERLLFEIAKIILAMRVTGSNLSGVCKLVFKISKNDNNDKLFLEDKILDLFLEALGSACPLQDAEACIYGYGALKFLTMNNTLLNYVLNLGILELMVLHMKVVNNARDNSGRVPEQTSHALFQLTGVLRNVAGEEEMFHQFVMTGAVNQLCDAMKNFSSDLDIISNVSRTLSIISTHDDCCLEILKYESPFQLFVKLFQKYPGRQDIVVRLGYALGNLMAKSDEARLQFYSEKGAVETMLYLLMLYLDKDFKITNNPHAYDIVKYERGSSGSVEDVIIKIIRILANMSINPIVGISLARTLFSDSSNNYDIGKYDLPLDDEQICHIFENEYQLSDILLTILRRKSVIENEEMIHSVLSTLNNLSYYLTLNTNINEKQLEISQVLVPLLLTENKECLVEVTRVFGNLTRFKNTRDYLHENDGMNKILDFLDQNDRELLCTTIGILVNMMADWDKRSSFKAAKGIKRMNEMLLGYEGDWPLCTLVCQLLWNYCTESTNLLEDFEDDEINQLSIILADFLDDERLFGIKEDIEVDEVTASSEYYQMWEEFAAVGTNLLEKIETFFDPLEPLEPLVLSQHNTENELEIIPIVINNKSTDTLPLTLAEISCLSNDRKKNEK